MGVPVVYEVGDDFDTIIQNWLSTDTPMPLIQANDINTTLQYLFDTYKD
jgi:hypothetical protein